MYIFNIQQLAPKMQRVSTYTSISPFFLFLVASVECRDVKWNNDKNPYSWGMAMLFNEKGTFVYLYTHIYTYSNTYICTYLGVDINTVNVSDNKREVVVVDNKEEKDIKIFNYPVLSLIPSFVGQGHGNVQ